MPRVTKAELENKINELEQEISQLKTKNQKLISDNQELKINNQKLINNYQNQSKLKNERGAGRKTIITKEIKDKIIGMYAADKLTIQKISLEIGISYGTVQKILKEEKRLER